MKTPVKILLLLIIVLAFFLRIYKINSVPPSLSWDQVAEGYNGYTIANYGTDEFGNRWPLVFRSFGDDKPAVMFYLEAISIKLLGLSDFSTDLPAIIMGVLCVLMIFLVAKLFFDSDLMALLASLFLAVSPYNLQYSRGPWDANPTLFFFLLGLWAFLKAIKDPKQSYLIVISAFSFGIDLFTYHSAKVVTPGIILVLGVLYFKQLIKLSKAKFAALMILVLFGLVLFMNPRVLGVARAGQAGIDRNYVISSNIYKSTNNYWLSYANLVKDNYLTHFTVQYLFISGDQNARQSIQTVGEFYKVDAILFILGAIFILLKYRRKSTLILIAWILLAPIPAALTKEVPHSDRALFMMGSMNILAGVGAGGLIIWLKRREIQIAALVVLLFTLAVSLKFYLNDYYNVYPQKYAIEWQYGMSQMVSYVTAHPEYGRVYVTIERHQPYIFFLYYLKEPLQNYLNTVVFNLGDSESYNLVSSFDRYHFGDWDPIESMPDPGVLYAVTPSQYDGLRYKTVFKIKDLIKYPSGEPAFYLVSVN